MKKLIAICVVAIFVGFISIGDSYADMVVDDFEAYSGANPIVDTWALTGGGAIDTEGSIIQGGLQSMKFSYDTSSGSGWVDASKWMVDLSDWTAVDTLSIYFIGASSNSAEKMYVCLIDDLYNYVCVYNDDPGATQATNWTNWQVNLEAFTGVDLANVLTFIIGFEPVDGGSGQVYFDDIELLGPPANDDCADAQPITNVTDLAFDTSRATFDGPGSCQTAPNIWYCYTASYTGDVTVSLAGSSFDTMLAVYDGCECYPTLGDLIECNDDADGVSQSKIIFDAEAGSQYLIEVGGWDGARGQGLITTIIEPDNTPPGQNVEVSDPETGTTMLFDTVESGGDTTVDVTQGGPPPPTGFKLVPLGTYYDIETTAVFSGMIQIAIEYDDTGLTTGQEMALKLRCYEEATDEWVNITTGLDMVNNIIYGETTHLSLFAITTAGILVEIDIKPGSCPNAINLGSHGVIPVAILSSSDFDATTVDPDTVELSGAGVAVRGKADKYMAHEEDINGDGLTDLLVQVKTENLDPESFQDGYAVLTGQTYEGVSIVGEDEIIIVPPE